MKQIMTVAICLLVMAVSSFASGSNAGGKPTAVSKKKIAKEIKNEAYAKHNAIVNRFSLYYPTTAPKTARTYATLAPYGELFLEVDYEPIQVPAVFIDDKTVAVPVSVFNQLRKKRVYGVYFSVSTAGINVGNNTEKSTDLQAFNLGTSGCPNGAKLDFRHSLCLFPVKPLNSVPFFSLLEWTHAQNVFNISPVLQLSEPQILISWGRTVSPKDGPATAGTKSQNSAALQRVYKRENDKVKELFEPYPGLKDYRRLNKTLAYVSFPLKAEILPAVFTSADDKGVTVAIPPSVFKNLRTTYRNEEFFYLFVSTAEINKYAVEHGMAARKDGYGWTGSVEEFFMLGKNGCPEGMKAEQGACVFTFEVDKELKPTCKKLFPLKDGKSMLSKVAAAFKK